MSTGPKCRIAEGAEILDADSCDFSAMPQTQHSSFLPAIFWLGMSWVSIGIFRGCGILWQFVALVGHVGLCLKLELCEHNWTTLDSFGLFLDIWLAQVILFKSACLPAVVKIAPQFDSNVPSTSGHTCLGLSSVDAVRTWQWNTQPRWWHDKFTGWVRAANPQMGALWSLNLMDNNAVTISL